MHLSTPSETHWHWHMAYSTTAAWLCTFHALQMTLVLLASLSQCTTELSALLHILPWCTLCNCFSLSSCDVCLVIRCWNGVRHDWNVWMQGSGKWFELQDLHTVDILPQMITLSESYVQVSDSCHQLITLVHWWDAAVISSRNSYKLLLSLSYVIRTPD